MIDRGFVGANLRIGTPPDAETGISEVEYEMGSLGQILEKSIDTTTENGPRIVSYLGGFMLKLGKENLGPNATLSDIVDMTRKRSFWEMFY